MAYNYITGYKTASGTATVAITINAGESVLVLAGNATATGATLTITDTLGNTWVSRGTRNDTYNGATRTLIDCLNAPNTGSTTLTLAGGGAYPEMVVVKYTGLSAYSAASFASSFYGSSPPTTTDGITTSAIAPSSYPAMVFGCSLTASGSALTAGTDFTSRYTPTGLSNGDMGWVEDARLTSGSHIASFTAATGSTSVTMIGAAYIEASGGGSGSAPIAWLYA